MFNNWIIKLILNNVMPKGNLNFASVTLVDTCLSRLDNIKMVDEASSEYLGNIL